MPRFALFSLLVLLSLSLACQRSPRLPERSTSHGYRSVDGPPSPRSDPSDPQSSAPRDQGVGAHSTNPRALCDGGSAPHCLVMGIIYERGLVGAQRAPASAARYYRSACDLGDQLGCHNLAVLLEAGRGVDADLPAALELYDVACRGGEPLACSNLGLAIASGRAGDPDHSRAIELYTRSCDGGAMIGCNNLAFALERGQGTLKDMRRSRQLYETACLRGHIRSCTRLSWLLAQRCGVRRQETCENPTSSEPEVVELLGQHCDTSSQPHVCTSYGGYVEIGRFVERDVAAARALFSSACDASSGWACASLGLSLRKDVERGQVDLAPRVLELHQRACSLGFLRSCRDAGSMLLNGDGVPRDAPRGLELVRNACASGARAACLDLRVMCTVGMAAACNPE